MPVNIRMKFSNSSCFYTHRLPASRSLAQKSRFVTNKPIRLTLRQGGESVLAGHEVGGYDTGSSCNHRWKERDPAMRICFVSTSKGWGGGEQLLAYLVDGVSQAGEEAALVARRNSPMADWGRKQQLSLRLEQSGRGRSPLAMWRLRRWLVDSRIDVLVLNDPHAITSGGLAALGTPVIRTGIRHTVFPIQSAWKHERLLDHVICVSGAAQTECTAVGISPEKTTVIYGGIPHLEIDPSGRDLASRMFRDACITASDRHLLAIGSLISVKGFDTSIRAIAQGVGESRPWHLWIAGEGPEKLRLESLASDLGISGRVHFLGFRSDIGELLSAADLFLSASQSEGLSLVLIEAMLAGCPIAATAVGGSREVLRVDPSGKSPFAALFDPGKHLQLVSAIESCLQTSPANRERSEAARRWAEHHFSVKSMAENHVALYHKLLGEQALPSTKSRRPAA
jgi:glycosyltransferase involved in cell wall biosynthesis